MNVNILAILYLASAALFILGLRDLTHPSTARRGNVFAITAMVISVLATLVSPEMSSYGLILTGVIIGGVIGTIVAKKIEMTSMPELVAALHSFVGLAAVLVAVGLPISITTPITS